MIIGFTGTRNGMTVQQRMRMHWILDTWHYEIEEAHHGDCKGSDEQFHDLCVVNGIRIVIHPPTDPKHRAFCSTGNVRTLGEKPYIARNHDIVDACGLLLSTPRKGHRPINLRGEGTWSTIGYAERRGTPVDIIRAEG